MVFVSRIVKNCALFKFCSRYDSNTETIHASTVCIYRISPMKTPKFEVAGAQNMNKLAVQKSQLKKKLNPKKLCSVLAD
uniref:Uncharacterized protein n=1 Tax=Caenorhabditis japonica TaxID=281687 RepID=A0A8R1EHX1_CAEJA